MKKGYFLDTRISPYEKIWELQKKLHLKRVLNEIPDTLIFTEHFHVYTIGKRGKEENFKVSKEFLNKLGIKILRVERGGDVTYHGPGQIVGYPIFYIKEKIAGIKKFINKIEDAIIITLKEYGIKGEKRENMIGVWVFDKKICSIGVAVKNFVSFHGFALNVNTDLKYFDYIFPCGMDKEVTSIEKLIHQKVDIQEVKQKLKKSFENIFEIEFENLNYDFLLNIGSITK
jgi:lipoate-protein ligase B